MISKNTNARYEILDISKKDVKYNQLYVEYDINEVIKDIEWLKF